MVREIRVRGIISGDHWKKLADWYHIAVVSCTFYWACRNKVGARSCHTHCGRVLIERINLRFRVPGGVEVFLDA